MDNRPDLKRRRRRNQALLGLGGLALVGLITVGLARLEPAAPRVDRAQVYTDTVKRGEMLRQVRGNGSLVPEKIVTVQSDTGGTVAQTGINDNIFPPCPNKQTGMIHGNEIIFCRFKIPLP